MLQGVDAPNFRGSTRRCPSCEGNPSMSFFSRRKSCETCFGTGVVHLGMMCKFCGRSVQYEYKGSLICGSANCEELVKKKFKQAYRS